jgi:hypothetical protein
MASAIQAQRTDSARTAHGPRSLSELIVNGMLVLHGHKLKEVPHVRHFAKLVAGT